MPRPCMQTLKRPRITGRSTMGLVTLLGSLHGCGSSTLKAANVSTTSLRHVVRLLLCLALLNRGISTGSVLYSELLRNRCGLSAVDGECLPQSTSHASGLEEGLSVTRTTAYGAGRSQRERVCAGLGGRMSLDIAA